MKSGEFAKLCETTKDTLLHYDRIGLLRPSYVRENGYRDYTMDDYGVFFTVKALTDAGLSLAEIKERRDLDDLLVFYETVKETQESLDLRIEELEYSRELLKEIAAQAREAVRRGLEDEGVVDVRIEPLPDRVLLVNGPAQVEHPGDSFVDLWPSLGESMKLVKMFGPRGQLSPYGLTARFVKNEPYYDLSYLMLPEGTKIGKDLKEEIQRLGFFLIVKPKGDYVVAAFNEEWPKVGKAYDAIGKFAREERIMLEDTFYETAALWFLDRGEKDRFRCTLSVRIKD